MLYRKQHGKNKFPLICLPGEPSPELAASLAGCTSAPFEAHKTSPSPSREGKGRGILRYKATLMKATYDLNLLFHLHSVTLGHGVCLNKTMISTSISTSISKRDSFSREDVVSRIWISYHTRPAHHVDRLGHLAALLVPDLLRLPALRLHCLEERKMEVTLLFGKDYLYVG